MDKEKSGLKQNITFISYAYALGALLVVLGHSTPTGESDLPLIIDAVRTFIYCFHMPLFFFIAGILFKYSVDNKGKKPYKKFISNKAIKFLVPYFVFTAVGFVPKLLVANYVNDNVSSSVSYVFEVIFNPRNNVWGHFWFLPTLLLMYVLSYLVLRLYENKVIFGILLIFSILLCCFPIETNWFALNDFSMQFVYFCFGVGFSNVVLKNRKRIFNKYIAIFSFLIGIGVFVLTYSYRYIYVVKYSSMFIVAVFMVYVVLTIACLLEDKQCKALDLLNGKTFTIYLLSWPCQAVTEIITNRILHLPWFITLFVMFFVGLFIPMLVYILYNKLKIKNKFLDLVLGV